MHPSINVNVHLYKYIHENACFQAYIIILFSHIPYLLKWAFCHLSQHQLLGLWARHVSPSRRSPESWGCIDASEVSVPKRLEEKLGLPQLRFRQRASATKTSKGGGFKHVVFIPLFAELIQFDEYVFFGWFATRNYLWWVDWCTVDGGMHFGVQNPHVSWWMIGGRIFWRTIFCLMEYGG